MNLHVNILGVLRNK